MKARPIKPRPEFPVTFEEVSGKKNYYLYCEAFPPTGYELVKEGIVQEGDYFKYKDITFTKGKWERAVSFRGRSVESLGAVCRPKK